MRIAFGILALLVLATSCSDSTSPPGPPAKLQIVTSTGLVSVVGDTVPPIVVDVHDANGRAVPDVTVSVVGTFGSIKGATQTDIAPASSPVRTDSRGRATIRIVAPTFVGTGIVYISVEPASAGTEAELALTTSPDAFAGFVEHSRTGLSGASFTLDSLFTPVDKYGNATTDPSTADFAATNGWNVTGATLTPPNASYTGTTIVSVTSGSVSSVDTVTVVEDLRQYHWNVQWKCDYTHTTTAGLPDSTSATGTNGHVTYGSDPGFMPFTGKVPVPSPVAEFWFTGTETLYRNGLGLPQDIMTGEPYGLDVFAQRPDTLVFGFGARTLPALRVPGALPRYITTGDWCGDGPLVLQAY